MSERLTPVSRTSFSLTDREAFSSALDLSLRWLAKTAKVELPQSAISGGGFEIDLEEAAAHISASRLDDQTGQIWAAQINFRGDNQAPRNWITDLFIESRKGDVTRFGAQLVCRHQPDDPGFENSRPRIIKDIIEALSAQADGVQIENDFTEVLDQEIDQFADLINRPDRRLPIVLFSIDDEGGAQIDLERLAKRISGTAHLKTIKAEASFELTRLVGKQMSTFDGAARVYLPGIDPNHEDHLRHPIWFAPRTGWNPRAAHQIASRVLPLGFRDAEGGTRFWRLGLLRQAASRAAADAIEASSSDKQDAEVVALRAELENAKEEAQTAESLMAEEAQKASDLDTEVARLEQENFDLRLRIRSLESGKTVATSQISEGDIRALADGEPTLETSLNIVGSLFADRIVILPSAIESARDSSVFRHRDKAFDLLWSLATSYYNALSNGESDQTAKKYLGSGYAAKEKETLSKQGRERRTFEYNGQPVEMMRHLKIGVADNKSDTLRVHFEWLASEGKIVIGHCGAHLDF